VVAQRMFVNFPLGYQWRDARLYRTIHRSNPFLSYAEGIDRNRADLGIQTVWHGNHDWALRSGSVRQVWTHPMWLQVLHGGNVANELRGLRRLSTRTPGGFNDLQLVDEPWGTRVQDAAAAALILLRLPWQRRASIRRRLRQSFHAMRPT
jgi:hypothetical protein